MNVTQIGHYVLSFYSDEEKASFNADLENCYNNAWLHPTHDYDYYAGLGKQVISVDSATNTLKVTYIIHNIDQICPNLFDPPKVGLNPFKKYIDENPGEGTYTFKVFDSNGNDVTSEHSIL